MLSNVTFKSVFDSKDINSGKIDSTDTSVPANDNSKPYLRLLISSIDMFSFWLIVSYISNTVLKVSTDLKRS